MSSRKTEKVMLIEQIDGYFNQKTEAHILINNIDKEINVEVSKLDFTKVKRETRIKCYDEQIAHLEALKAQEEGFLASILADIEALNGKFEEQKTEILAELSQAKVRIASSNFERFVHSIIDMKEEKNCLLSSKVCDVNTSTLERVKLGASSNLTSVEYSSTSESAVQDCKMTSNLNSEYRRVILEEIKELDSLIEQHESNFLSSNKGRKAS